MAHELTVGIIPPITEDAGRTLINYLTYFMLNKIYVFIFIELLFLNVYAVSQSEIARRLDKSIDNGNEAANCEGSGMLPRSEITHGEHPLSLGKTSVWNQFFQVLF